MEYYRFKVTDRGNENIKTFGKITFNSQDFKSYNKYLG